ncbi:sodium-coupled monocarboxylate transporter 1-like [Patiria miniata]|uniref:Sodium-dependent multivitamin transporter n=1 Tax=Patiria miniata TaxID=46514 RepID=A0A914BLJ4_PATMI|nr:sodium-coupled monocarboxylate transporter 1-like [Patiria miniata]
MDGAFGSRSYFKPADYIVCGVMILASVAIGLYYGLKGGGQRTSASYILADRSMTLVPVTLSLLASFFSGISLQGYPADVYYHGPTVFWMAVPFLLGGVLCWKFFLPMFYRLGMASAYEYLELRFNHAVKICGVMSFLIFSVLYSGVVAFTACVALTAVTGINVEVAIVGLCVVCAIYTVIGGIKAVLWTDSLQMLLMLTTTIAIIAKCSMTLGIGNVWQIASTGSRTNFFYFNSDLTDFYNGWSFIGQTMFLGVVITNQYMVQRLVICKSEAVARASFICYVFGVIIFQSLLFLVGISIYAYYEGCDPSTMGYMTKNDQIVPYFIVDVFSDLPGIPGLLLTGLFGAALSTLSSVFNASATLVGEHFVKPYWKDLKDKGYTVALKVIAVFASAAALGMAFLIPVVGDAIPVVLTFAGCSTAGCFALFIIGVFCPFCGSKSVVTGFVVGLIVAVTMSVGCIIHQVKPDNLPLSAEMCLNETYMDMNDTLVTATSLGTQLPSTVNLTQIMMTESYINRSEGPVIFSLAKSWLSLLTFLTTILATLFATLVTGTNDTSNMDPRLVIWKIKTSFVPSEKPQIRGIGEYSPLSDMECENLNNKEVSNGKCENDSTEAIAIRGNESTVEFVTAM